MTYPKAGPEGADAANAEVPASPSFPQIEDRVRAYWHADGTFQASIDARSADGSDGATGGNEFVFYDGPPFANGLPHYGHLLTGYVKDVVPRYKTMRGRRVERRFGWDCHGLPAEVEAERQLGIKHKSEIEALGVAAFNDACKTSVLRYTAEWEEYVDRQARWVDFENDYKTLDLDYMESVLWAFKTLWDKGLVYEGFRVLAYCWRCETPLSNTETRMDDVYRQRQDPAVTVGLELLDGPAAGALALIWTTTPWTLPSNLAVAVHPDLRYVVLTESAEDGARRLLLAADRVGHYARELGVGNLDEAREAGRVVAEYTGSELLGSRYTPPFTFFAGRENAHQVLPADYVTTDDGTGLVHIAPAFGEEDKVVTDAAGIEPVVPVDGRGEFTTEVPPYAGQQVFTANKSVITDLKAASASASASAGDGASRPEHVGAGTYLLRQETYDHPYPHCWRCGEPLIYKAVSSWFVKVTAFRDRMVELNQQIRWVPDHIKDGSFGKWLENARDWSISRNRYWGSPIPVWVSDDPAYPRTDVYGSLEELQRDFGVEVTDLHRPFVDELTRPNPDDPRPEGERSTMRRVPEVLDCWFESGSMPFAQVHYPFENREWFEHHYPGDFIVEYIGQTRGWFYTLHVLATALFDRPAFDTCVSHGILLGDDGRKMSKSLRNYPGVNEVLDRDGADAMRWFLMSSPVLRGGNLIVTDQGIRDSVRQVLIPLWNVWYFFVLYANSANDGTGYSARWRTDSDDVLDRYVLAKTHDLVGTVTEQLDAYDIAGACASVRDFIDGLSNWYVRRSRDRFWSEDENAFDTLFTVLEVLTRVASPLLPLVGEEIWRGLTGGRSVHLTDWPSADELPADDALVAAMDAARSVCSVALAIRKSNALRVRQPLRTLTVAGADAEALAPFADLIKDEVNVKEVRLESLATTDFTLVPNARALGPRLGRDVQTVIKAAKAGEFTDHGDGTVTAAGHLLQPGEFELKPAVKDPQGSRFEDARLIALDTELDEALEAEGWVRDVVRQVQDARKAAGLHVSDVVRLELTVPQARFLWADHHQAYIAKETLAGELQLVPAAEAGAEDVEVAVSKLG